MSRIPSYLRIAIAALLLLAQVSGGSARVVHCYDASCDSTGMTWECHFSCGGNHGLDGQACENQHEHDGRDCKFGESVTGDSEVHVGEVFVESEPCGSDHHHHYVSTVDLANATSSAVDQSRGQCDVVFFEPSDTLLAISKARLSLKFESGVGFHPAIPLELRLRI